MAARAKVRESREGFDQVAIRLPVAFFERVDRHLERMKEVMPAADLKRADALRNLIALGLAQSENA
jgi:hypothetical protein